MNIIETNLSFNTMDIRKSTNRIILHHSGVNVRQSIQIIHDYHKATNGWAGIGYHFYIRTDGSIYRGRPENTVGAHAGGNNSDSIGICFEGNYSEETMTKEQENSGKELLNYLKEKYNVNVIQKHYILNKTDCPGTNFPFDEIAGTGTTQESVEENKETSKKEFEKFDERIREYQKLLNTIYGAGLKEDGYWGPKTAKATKMYVALKNGSKGNLVRWYQSRLKELGYDLGTTGNNGVDGDYRIKTQNATKSFEEKHGLNVDKGIAGIQVIRKIVELM